MRFLKPQKQLKLPYLLRCQEAARNAGVKLPEQEPPVFTNFVR